MNQQRVRRLAIGQASASRQREEEMRMKQRQAEEQNRDCIYALEEEDDEGFAGIADEIDLTPLYRATVELISILFSNLILQLRRIRSLLLLRLARTENPEQWINGIKELVQGDVPSQCRAYGDATILNSVGLCDLHPTSWYSVAWYPIYRIPGGNFRAAFLTYHSLGHLVPLLISFDAVEVRKQAAASTQRFEEERIISAIEVFLDGGLNQQRMGICDAVAVAKILNAALVIPQLEVNPVWKDSSSFMDIFDVDHFIDVLKDDISIVKELPEDFSWSTRDYYATAIRATRIKTAPVHASANWYPENVCSVLESYGIAAISPFSHRLAFDNMPKDIQRLRCKLIHK